MKVLLFTILVLPQLAVAQEKQPAISKYGLPVINDIGTYKSLVNDNSDNQLIDLRQLIPDAKFDIRYATPENLVHKPVYPTADIFLRKPAAMALLRAQQILAGQGLGLLFFDGYRPYEVTVIFYETIKDTTFVADPRKGSRHNRGMAVDLGLFDLKTGQPLPMPSDYDETTERAYHSYMDADSLAINNRKILRTTMEDAGFEIYPWEWWHYDFNGWKNAALFDIWHSEIRRANLELAKKKYP